MRPPPGFDLRQRRRLSERSQREAERPVLRRLWQSVRHEAETLPGGVEGVGQIVEGRPVYETGPCLEAGSENSMLGASRAEPNDGKSSSVARHESSSVAIS